MKTETSRRIVRLLDIFALCSALVFFAVIGDVLAPGDIIEPHLLGKIILIDGPLFFLSGLWFVFRHRSVDAYMEQKMPWFYGLIGSRKVLAVTCVALLLFFEAIR